jgi:hypothetical protein
METARETLEKISDLGTPKGLPKSDQKHKFKFRVTFQATVRGAAKAMAVSADRCESSFSYYDLVSARKCYRDILLSFYKGKEIESFAVCLNHYGSKKWEKPIYAESADDGS